MDLYKVDIIIPFYNDSENLRKTIASCLMQNTLVNIIVVNDCSTEEPSKKTMMLIELAHEYVVLDKNVGLAGARNRGLQFAVNDFFIPLDTGDYLYPNVLGAMLAEGLNGNDVVFGNCTQHDDFDVSVPPGARGITRDGWLKDNQIWCSSLYRTSMVRDIDYYDDSLHTHYEDYEMNVKLWLYGARFKYINRTIYRHVYNPDSMLSKLHQNTEYYKEIARRPLYA